MGLLGLMKPVLKINVIATHNVNIVKRVCNVEQQHPKKLTRGMLKSLDTSMIAFEIVLQTGPIIANAFGLIIISLKSMSSRAYCIEENWLISLVQNYSIIMLAQYHGSPSPAYTHLVE